MLSPLRRVAIFGSRLSGSGGAFPDEVRESLEAATVAPVQPFALDFPRFLEIVGAAVLDPENAVGVAGQPAALRELARPHQRSKRVAQLSRVDTTTSASGGAFFADSAGKVAF